MHLGHKSNGFGYMLIENDLLLFRVIVINTENHVSSYEIRQTCKKNYYNLQALCYKPLLVSGESAGVSYFQKGSS